KKIPDSIFRTKRCGCPWMVSVGFSKKRGDRNGKKGRFTKINLEHNHPVKTDKADKNYHNPKEVYRRNGDVTTSSSSSSIRTTASRNIQKKNDLSDRE